MEKTSFIEGVDFSYQQPSGSVLRNSGKTFAIRYLSSQPKGIRQEEVNDLLTNGIAIVLAYEEKAISFQGYHAGVNQAKKAQALLEELSLPKSLSIYFCVDWEATIKDHPKIEEALKGVISVIGIERTGIYGSYSIMNRCKSLASWFWQTYAWSNRKVADHIHLYQYLNNQKINNCGVDFNRALQINYGQYQLKNKSFFSPQQLSTISKMPVSFIHKIKKRENLKNIALIYNTTIDDISAINNIVNPNLIYEGQQLTVIQENNQINNIINQFFSWEDYKEKKERNYKYYEKKSENAGNKNYCRFNRIYENIVGYKDGVIDNGDIENAAWCASTILATYYEALVESVDTSVDEGQLIINRTKINEINEVKRLLLCEDDFNNKYDYCRVKSYFTKFRSKDQWHTTNPQRGDLIIFGYPPSTCNHIGLVYGVDNKTVYTIEGNTASDNSKDGLCLKIKEYPLYKDYKANERQILGYCRPKYNMQ